MGASTTTQTRTGKTTTENHNGILKLRTSPARPKRYLRSTSKHFWYTASDGTTCVASNSGTDIIPTQINDYDFDPSFFANEPRYASFPENATWPPQRLEDVLSASAYVPEDGACVGEICYTDTVCQVANCGHTFEQWRKATADWEEHFELRMTEGMGIGAFAKREFEVGDVLGWYTGELRTLDNCGAGDYLMEVDVGLDFDHESESGSCSPYDDGNEDSEDEHEAEGDEDTDAPSIYIDSERKGNWTRFINHSCSPHAVFRMRRVGNTKIMTIEAIRHVHAGAELTVNYGIQYYGMDSLKICRCGVKNCVGKKRALRDAARERLASARRGHVKKCRRTGPP